MPKLKKPTLKLPNDLTLLDYFASKALPNVLSLYFGVFRNASKDAAILSYEIAQSMLDEKKRLEQK